MLIATERFGTLLSLVSFEVALPEVFADVLLLAMSERLVALELGDGVVLLAAYLPEAEVLVLPDVALVESDFASSCPATPPIAPPATAPTGPPTTAPPTAPDAAPTVVACSFFVKLSHVEHPASATIASAMALLLKPVDVMKISFR